MPLAAWSHLGNNLPANSLTLSFRRRFDRGLGLLLLMISEGSGPGGFGWPAENGHGIGRQEIGLCRIEDRSIAEVLLSSRCVSRVTLQHESPVSMHSLEPFAMITNPIPTLKSDCVRGGVLT